MSKKLSSTVALWVRSELRQHKQPGVASTPVLSPPAGLYTERRHQSQMCHSDIYKRAWSLMVYNYKSLDHTFQCSLTSMKNLSLSRHAGFSPSAPSRHRDSFATESALTLCFIHIFPCDPIFSGLGGVKRYGTKAIFHRA